ncbi:MAG: 50S ribosomal protein L22 [Candidatus Pacebacteria bacterium]|nr:50S ribosomal protein L22 [Candidatus Paceibacterota bacterium]
MKAFLKNYRQSPRKVRLVADLVRGKSVLRALTALSFLEKKSALPMKKLIESAVSNAEQQGVKREELKVSEIKVDEGLSFVRFRARARGRAAPIKKRSSHIHVALGKVEK